MVRPAELVEATFEAVIPWAGAPVTGALGLGLLVGACALAGASVIRKRNILLMVLLAVCVPAALSSAQVVSARVVAGERTIIDEGEHADFASDGTTIIAVYHESSENGECIFVGISDDGGESWDTDDLADSSGDDIEPAIATNGSGLWVVIYAEEDETEDVPGTDALMFTKSTDDGANWTSPVAIANESLLANFTIADEDGEPDVAIDGTTIIAVCSDLDDDLITVTSTDSGDNWDTPVEVGEMREPRIATDGAGVWIVAGDNGGDTAIRRSTNDGTSWTEIVVTVDAEVEHGEQVGHADGTWILVASGDAGASVYPGELNAYRSTSDGATWSAKATITTRDPNDTNLDIASNGAGRWLVAAEGTDASDSGMVLAASVDDGVTWGSITEVTPVDTDFDDMDPQLLFVDDDAKADGSSNFLMIYGKEDGIPDVLDLGDMIEVVPVKVLEQTWLGFEYFVGAPVAGVVGLGLLIGACALAGASIIRRKK